MAETRFRILMVDDVTRYQKLYELAITDALPASVSFATNGEEALKKLDSPVAYDLLILDLNMPKLGGEETLKRLRQDPNFDDMPVIILTGDTDQETHRRLLELGADDFVEKGLPPELFVSRLKAQMRHKLTIDRLARMAVDMDIFAAGVLHDIRNIEMNIITICELTRDAMAVDPVGQRDQMLKDFLSLEKRAVDLGKYAADIIDMVRETNKRLDYRPQNPRELLEWVFRIAKPEGPSCQTHSLTHAYCGEIHAVIADRHFLQLALLNIVQNSVKYARPGTPPHVDVSQEIREGSPGETAGKRALTRVRDNGIGISRQELRKVFQPFVRGRDPGTGSGFGLGLSLVVKVINTMGGRVWAELPEDGPGTTICIDLPLAEDS